MVDPESPPGPLIVRRGPLPPDVQEMVVAAAARTGRPRQAAEEMGFAPTSYDATDDYPDFAIAVARAVVAGQAELGLMICGTGVGSCIAANKVPGIRAAVWSDVFSARYSRRPNDANVLCLGGRVTGSGVALQIVDVFLATPFDGGRHEQRVHKVDLTS